MPEMPEMHDDCGDATHYTSLENGDVAAEKTARPGTPSTDGSASLELELQDPCDDGTASSAVTVDELHDRTGFAIVCWIVFLADMSRGVVFPTLWPLIRSVGGTEVDLGTAVAAYSVGRAFTTAYYGRLSRTYGYRKILLGTTALLLASSLLYALSPRVGRPSYVVLCQTLLGVGSSTLGLARAYTAEVTAQRAKTAYLSYLSAMQYFGFSVTPVLGSALTLLLGDGAFAAPGVLLALACAATLWLLFARFEDRQRPGARGGGTLKGGELAESPAERKTFLGIDARQAALIGCIYLNVVVKGMISVFETLGVQIADAYFGMPSSTAGAIVAVCGAVGVGEALAMGRISRWLTDSQMIVWGMGFLSLGLCCLLGLEDGPDNGGWRYVLSVFCVYGAGYSLAQAAVLGLFAKVVGRAPQGELMGWFAFWGAVPRMVYPLASGYLAYHGNVGLFAAILVATLAASIVYVLLNMKEFEYLSR